MYSMIREIFIDNKKLRNVFGDKEKYNENILMCSLIINDDVRRPVSNSSSMFAGDCLPFITRCIAKIYYHHDTQPQNLKYYYFKIFYIFYHLLLHSNTI